MSTADSSPPAVDTPGFRTALRFWLKLGCISFGGPAGQIAIMHDELVERRRWISEGRFLHALAYCFALPGPEAQQLATYVGWRMHGLRGALAAGGLFVLPSFVLLCALSYVYVAYGDVAVVAGVVRGLGGAVVGLVLAALLRVGGRVAHTPLAVTIAVVAFASMVAGVPFPIVLIGAAFAGVALERHRPGSFPGMGHGAPESEVGATGAIRHDRRGRRIVATVVCWLAPVGLLVVLGGVIADLAGFFSLAALITFGGAYAVLPFVADQAVNRFGWLTSPDMVAGLALGETTPGPLIMVNTFVGYLAGWTTMGSHSWALGGAAVATFCTFAPSFAFIILGGPFVDRMPRSGVLATALHGVSVAVVGVIGALAVFVGRHVLVVDGRIDWLAIVVAVGALVGLTRLRLNVLWIIGVAALAGLVAGPF